MGIKTVVELDQIAIDAAIARSPFNANEKTSAATHRRVLALAFKDGYREACSDHAAAMAEKDVQIEHAKNRIAATEESWDDAEDRVKKLQAKCERMEAALRGTIELHERNSCKHEDTHRGGAIWMICDGCDMKWADDRGGFVPYAEPKEIAIARTVLTETK